MMHILMEAQVVTEQLIAFIDYSAVMMCAKSAAFTLIKTWQHTSLHTFRCRHHSARTWSWIVLICNCDASNSTGMLYTCCLQCTYLCTDHGSRIHVGQICLPLGETDPLHTSRRSDGKVHPAASRHTSLHAFRYPHHYARSWSWNIPICNCDASNSTGMLCTCCLQCTYLCTDHGSRIHVGQICLPLGETDPLHTSRRSDGTRARVFLLLALQIWEPVQKWRRSASATRLTTML